MKNRFNGNISLNYGINQYAETLADAYRHGNTRQSVIIEFQIPIFQWGINKNNIRIAKNNYDASRLRIEKKIFEFENEVKEKINAYDHSVKLWLTASRAYALSKEQYKMLTKKFSLGKVSVYELATAQKSGMMLCSVTTLPSKILTKASLHYVIWLYMILKKMSN